MLAIYFLVLTLLIIGCLFYLVLKINAKDYIEKIPESKFGKLGQSLGIPSQRTNCMQNVEYCFTDNECQQRCTNSGTFKCTRGICKQEELVSSIPLNLCDAVKGFVAYFVGNPAFGNFKYICKSVDPVIAKSPQLPNLMCRGSVPPLEENYLLRYPDVSDCLCTDKIIVPATMEKRKHIECNSKWTALPIA